MEANQAMSKELVKSGNQFLVDTFVPRIFKCLEHLSEEDIWLKPNKNTPSVGNLILHLNGNVHQWIVATLGGEPDIRIRSSEFNETNQPKKGELIMNLSETTNQAKKILSQLSFEDLLKTYKVQDFVENGITILMHVVEHFSYHVGQITYFVKSRKGIDIGYYSGRNLDQTN